jgi:large subunit ribosomal protein L17
MSNMAVALIRHKSIRTTLAKAKALRPYVEPLITKSKTDTTHSRRIVFSYLRDKEATQELFGAVAPRILNRNGGYTRILKLGTRLGDGAEMALIELVDFNEFYTADTAKKTRRRRAGKKKTDGPAAAAAAVVQAAESAPLVDDNSSEAAENKDSEA